MKWSDRSAAKTPQMLDTGCWMLDAGIKRPESSVF